MDVKAMARSKRSHTKHHQPRKPHRPNTKSTASSSLSSKDPRVLKEGERKKSNPGSFLPSNRDRYYDSDEDKGLFGSDSESTGGPASMTDVVKPKSNGADFALLISEAMSQSSANFSSTFDDLLPDFSQGLGSMLSVRGENILSWTGSENFLMEDEVATSQEVPFLSLNLQTLAEEVARIDLAQRLFIEEDILPPELRAPQNVERDSPMSVSASVDDLAFQYSSKVEKRTESKGHSLRSDSVDTSNRSPLSFRQKGELDDNVAAHESDSFRVLDQKESFKATQKTEIEDKMPRFEAGAAETELDRLLDSFNETTFFGSSNANSNEQKNSATSNDSTHLDFGKSSLLASNIDNDIDELLQETSVGFAISHSTEVNADSAGTQMSLSSTQPGTKSKVMEDFDSWLDTI